MSFAGGVPLKRFYERAEAVADGGRFHIALDGRPVRTPGRKRLEVPTRALAEALAEEWAAQGETIDPMSMPLTRLVNTACDGVADAMDAVAEEIVRYAASDLLCYRAASPQRLTALQRAFWDPVLEWVADRFGARFLLSEGVVYVEQPAESLARIAENLPADPLRLAAVSLMTTLGGSVLLAFAVRYGRLSPEEAWRAAHIDEEVQESVWGLDQEAEFRRDARSRDYRAAAKLIDLIDE